MKKGTTLVELVVAMGIFATIATLIVGGFVAVSRMKSLTSTMREVQQKTRFTLETITRLSRQAEKVLVLDNGKKLELYFDIDKKQVITGAKFEIESNTLIYSVCENSHIHSTRLTCNRWSQGTDMYRGINLQETETRNSIFVKAGTEPPTLTVKLYGKIEDVNDSPFFTNEINLDTMVILENIK